MSSRDIKDFYKNQKKEKNSKSKPPSSSSSKSSKKSGGGGGATLFSGDPPQAPALIAHGSYDLDNEYSEEERKLRGFDMDMRYGPCLGMTRFERWQRAESMGLDPPKEIEQILLRSLNENGGGDKKLDECLWEGRV